ncbi:hypothetical protein PUNSTDRAFT_133427 [Punctularia strigosozonata HHB-11173 SS5]|uniref:uncharacterized protein n=1 Tax=Punctularia strigosozonata (strain HHB-11173) TaxID=741275 RepID=UPI0004416CD7|nr:uncharacterized protein PUNSTDRAFT_133427 [Punctularia strigosozonata HHB-11173 SS5]EIN09649.1 hypothetical protein PUNSTDRAFT_133427 [Punctularia strigosozonata HHB-11173 SS5]
MAPVESEDSTKMNGFALLGAFPPPPTQPVNVTDRHFNGIIRSVLLSSGESATTTWGFPEISAQVSGRERVDAKRVDSFKQFQKSVTLLREQLSMMARDIRSICRHHEVIHSVIRLDKALEILHFLVYENAAALYPQDGKIQFQDGRQEYYGYKLNGHHFEQPGASSEYFTTQLKKVLVSLRTFYNCLMAVPDFRRHAGEGSLTAFEEDLEFWFLHCSDFPRARFREHTIRLFMLELSKHIKHDMDGMCEVITSLRKEAITVLKREQQERSSRYTYLTAVATLLSGVTATMLQFQGGTSKSAADANATFAAFWYLSLVLSIACAVNSLAGYAWIETKL